MPFGFKTWAHRPRGVMSLAQRRELMARLRGILQDDGPIVQPVWRRLFTFLDKRVQGCRMHPTGDIFSHQLAITA